MVQNYGEGGTPNVRADLKGMQFPATKEQIVERMSKKGPERAETARKLPDRQYESIEAVQAELKKNGSS
ncbi:DUF2795 domain-containing protein [Streptomyces sp. NPDC000410]|uniref:DUF2795 domain-containing protein n=1 Tax=Streptomyces sp. NPDC000410 TaxID=3154254 RepID=UPI00332AB3D4